MDREYVLTVLGVVLTGLAFRVGAYWPLRDPLVVGIPRQAERRYWREIWTPLAPAAVALCALAGWAALEPDDSELVPWTLWLLSIPCVFIWMRAIWRAVKALTRQPAVRAAGVMGLWRPRIVISDQFRARIDEPSAAAAIAHEAAHVRHRDPLRLWLAQCATDLQWPSRRAAERLRTWMQVVECARDDEAREAGIEGADLAAAILAAVGLYEAERCAPALGGEPTDLETRIRRLLEPAPSGEPVGYSVLALVLASTPVLVGVAIAGALFGEAIVSGVFILLP